MEKDDNKGKSKCLRTKPTARIQVIYSPNKRRKASKKGKKAGFI